jgi:inner membrane transporter RhtA
LGAGSSAPAGLPLAKELLDVVLKDTAAVVGAVVLRQIPTLPELAGIGLVVAAVGVHRDADAL